MGRSEENFKLLNADDRVWWGEDGNNIPSFKQFLSEVRPDRVPQTLWNMMKSATRKTLLRIIDFATLGDVFVTPKPSQLFGRILELATDENSIVMDSFAGPGTTAQAVLEANKRDSGNRRFILVEMEDYADRLTSERVRRLISGYDFNGTQRTELLREKLSWTAMKKAAEIVERVEAIETAMARNSTRSRSRSKAEN